MTDTLYLTAGILFACSMWNDFLKNQVDHIKDRIKSKTGPSNVFVTGHSLGAVMTQCVRPISMHEW